MSELIALLFICLVELFVEGQGRMLFQKVTCFDVEDLSQFLELCFLLGTAFPVSQAEGVRVGQKLVIR